MYRTLTNAGVCLLCLISLVETTGQWICLNGLHDCSTSTVGSKYDTEVVALKCFFYSPAVYQSLLEALLNRHHTAGVEMS